MFPSEVYVERRKRLKQQIGSGMILFLGNDESPMNYRDNGYHYRQDSSFLYYFGLDFPGLAALIDVDADEETLFGDDYTIDQIVWMGPQPTIRERGETCGVANTVPAKQLGNALQNALHQERRIHFLPQYRAENLLRLEALLGLHPRRINDYVSESLIMAVAAQRSVKSDLELAEIEHALEITREMHVTAMQMTRPGVYEREVAGRMEGIALAHGGRVAYPVIFSVRGETLHNHFHGNQMKAGELALNDSGAENPNFYCGDITRTIPVGGTFSPRQREIYLAVYAALEKCLQAVKSEVKFRDIYLLACRSLFDDLKALGLMKGDAAEGVAAGAHGIFFQCGVGHMIGMDVHDMEGLGEQYVGYDDTVQRSSQFGMCYLRLAKALQPGYVVAVEPGVYFIPQLIDRWRAERKFAEFINYDKFETYKGFGGVRIEDNVVVTESGCRILGPAIPKTLDAVEALAGKR